MSCRILLVCTATVLAVSATPSADAAQTGASCTFYYTPRLDPGLTLSPGAGKVTSEPSVANCNGTLNGDTITGPGAFDFQGTYNNATCQGGGTGIGFINTRIPTSAGEVVSHDPITFEFGTGSGFPPGVGDWHGKRTTGQYLVLPSKGDCVATALTEAKGQGTFEISN